jgi:UDP-N-acetylmuramyl tripeptide synthase
VPIRDGNTHPLTARARAALAVVVGRAAGATARRLHLGGGTSLPGLVASRIAPDIVAYLGAQLCHGSAVVTGTNGKTTTSGLLAYTLRDAGLRVWRNREGANLLRGVTAALVIRAEPHGRLRRGGNAAAVFEVDEAAFPRVVAELRPRAIVVTNLFRDQLDRYGEVDTVAERWRAALAAAPAGAGLALNADDPAIAALGDGFPGTVLYYGVDDVGEDDATGREAAGEVIDTRTCPRCHAPLTYARRFYSHIGHWACPACGYTRPTPAVRARAVAPEGLVGTHFQLETPDGAAAVTLLLPGLYNVYNSLAAVAAGRLMGANLAATRRALERFVPAFGRAERIQVGDREIRLLLAKNPTGLNEVLRALALTGAGARAGAAGADDGRPARLHLFLLLNDRAADGHDVSWIWDADFERVASLAQSIVVSGTRAADLAVRLKYAGVLGVHAESTKKVTENVSEHGGHGRSSSETEGTSVSSVSSRECSGPFASFASSAVSPVSMPPAPERPIGVAVEQDVARALDLALANVPAGETLYVVPTYTAMLAVRGELERRGYVPRYWQAVDA